MKLLCERVWIIKLKDLKDQVIVITGASSGIGLVTARMAAKRGARVVLNARNEEALRRVTKEINAEGGKAIHVAGDVGRFDDVQTSPTKPSGASEDSIPGSTTPACRSMDQCWTSRCKISDACLIQTIGAWSMALWSLAITYAHAVAR